MSKELPHILMVEDEPSIAELLRFTMQGAGFATTIATDVAQARKLIAESLPHVVLLDWMLPDSSGLVLLAELRRDQRTAALPVIMLTAKGMEEDKVKGLNEGADDYVTKPFSPKELVARVQALLRRKTPEIGSQALRYGDISIDVERRQVAVAGRSVALDQAEFKLLRYLVAHPERIFSRAQLLDRVWGDHTFIEERTVDVHIMRLRKSLGDLAYYVQTVRGMGYKLSTEH
ncbi:phosphate regulon two-component response regulator transcription regulator protein [Herbaspirillum sp. GW103]|jgi:two-component system phosphate regulon response regulator PhoB|uniref:response regulator n=1 Tax=unclassified Herbaspirillum TaxID=2624150 RepID=UPI00025E3B28|nr:MULTISPECIES: response regulator [unclassified Herbaspirillum]EIJ46551.1 phosphate regulon two-component response regulator transcription regulator protein [Herbaspirillum sp. GW103]MCI1003747.1 winged helix-turn-helix domain-containing protein [Herbaspirillum sp. C7C8]